MFGLMQEPYLLLQKSGPDSSFQPAWLAMHMHGCNSRAMEADTLLHCTGLRQLSTWILVTSTRLFDGNTAPTVKLIVKLSMHACDGCLQAAADARSQPSTAK